MSCFPHRFPMFSPCGFTQTQPKWPTPKCLPSRWDVRQLELFNPGHPAAWGKTMASGSWSKSSHILLGVYPRFYKPLYMNYIYIYYIHIGDDEYSIYFWVYHIVTLAYEFRRLFLVETTRRSCCKHWHLDVAPVTIYTPCHNGRGFLLSLDLCAPSTVSV